MFKSLGLGDLSYMPEPVLLDIMESGEAEWHKARKMGIGGSDAGAVRVRGVPSANLPISFDIQKL